MRVLWLSHSARVGGAELSLAEGAKALSLRGHECHVVLPREGPLADRVGEWAEVQVIAHNPWLAYHRSPVISARWAQYNLRRAAPDIARMGRRITADLVVTNTITVPTGAVAARLARLPHVWFLHEFGSEDHGLYYLAGRRPTLLLMRALTDLFLVSSTALRSFHAPKLHGRPVHVVHYSVEVPDLTVTPADSTAFRVILLGAKLPGKGHLDAIAAVAELARAGMDVQLDLVGGGSAEYEAELRRRVRGEGLDDRVRFVGFRADALSLLASSDVALMCSRSEAFGRVTVEAMKLARPVVGSASGATPRVDPTRMERLSVPTGRPERPRPLAAGTARRPKDGDGPQWAGVGYWTVHGGRIRRWPGA
jgi:glycosyltransferase involved in cell wall biosynthesis